MGRPLWDQEEPIVPIEQRETEPQPLRTATPTSVASHGGNTFLCTSQVVVEWECVRRPRLSEAAERVRVSLV